ncbi:sigma-70 family RNA polymerase sigma factor [Leifsonia shinshuensis]|uniref:RNA polymerase sigma factor n=1 Tax=Leifsonia shinshuensis TaxID=150026 RepID=UPI001F5136FA|nr:sigma-70 family RNA polymerase sigma factor [Leifsonia shinshuensis]MCI0155154.1 sigma-70 family RNA polymerase sigma factor [Leifsonia shinshuensis]
MTAAERLERAYREDAARILGAVARTTGDLLLAEDAVQEAFARALVEAARGREPANPAAWITTVARRVAIDVQRRERTSSRVAPMLAAQLAIAERSAVDGDVEGGTSVFTGDERLELILLVAHPDLAQEARVALALRHVCGVPTARIAEAFLVSEPTMAARLTRAKKRIHDSGIRFSLDDPAMVSARMPDALTTVYLLYSAGHAAADDRLRGDAIALARDAHRLTGEPESAGLLALLLLTEARQATRLTSDDEFATLREADRSRWDVTLLAEGERLATEALTGVGAEGDGRYALQAGIAGLHAIAPSWDATDWPLIVRLYDGLVRVWPSAAARLGRLVAVGHSPDAGPEVALAGLDADPVLFEGPLAPRAHAARAELLRLAGATAAAAVELRRAIAASGDDRTRRSLQRLLDAGAV